MSFSSLRVYLNPHGGKLHFRLKHHSQARFATRAVARKGAGRGEFRRSKIAQEAEVAQAQGEELQAPDAGVIKGQPRRLVIHKCEFAPYSQAQCGIQNSLRPLDSPSS